MSDAARPGVIDGNAALDRLRALGEAARELVEASRAPNTVRAYRSDWRQFTGWCAANGLEALPAGADTVALYLAGMAAAGAEAVTIQRRLSAISPAHQAAGHVPSPPSDFLVRQVMRGIRRTP